MMMHSLQPDHFKVISIRRIELQTESLNIFQGKRVRFDIGCLCIHSPAMCVCAGAFVWMSVYVYRLGIWVKWTFIQ